MSNQVEEISAAPGATDQGGWEWAIVEIFGHRRHVGRVIEEERFGAKMLRIDVPVDGDPVKNGWKTHWYGGSSIFSLALTDEASALKANTPYDPPARLRWQPPEPESFGEFTAGDDVDAAGSDEPEHDAA